MNANIQTITLDLTNSAYSAAQKVFVVQGDSGTRPVKAVITDNGMVRTDLSHESVCLYIDNNGDRPTYVEGISVVNGVAEFNIPQSAVLNAGTVRAALRFVDEENRVLTSVPFVVEVGASVYDENALLGTDDGDALIRMVEQAEESAEAAAEMAGKVERLMDSAVLRADIDNCLDSESTNPVENKAVAKECNAIWNELNTAARMQYVENNFVSTLFEQGFEDGQKATARGNINAQKTLPNELEHTKNIGFFINHKGEKKTHAGFFMTNPIQFNVGDVIVVNGRGYLQQTAIVSLYNSDAETYTPKLVSYDSAIRYYSYEVEEAGEYVISCEKSNTTYGIPKLYKLTSDCGEFLKTLGVVTTKQEKEIVAQNSTLAQQETRLSNLENITSQVDLSAYASIAMFQKIGVIGDSFASGAISQSQGNPSNVNYPLSWAQILGRSAGIQVENFSNGGYSTRTWLTGAKGLSLLNSSDSQELYICALGINDCNLGETYLGDISDIKDNFEENADSFYGNYGKIIENIKIKSPNAKIILSTLASNSNTAQMFNTAIVEISEHFSIPYIVQRDEPFFTSSFYTSNMVSAHPVAVVYSGMAKAIQRLVEKCMVENIEYFKDYIGIE